MTTVEPAHSSATVRPYTPADAPRIRDITLEGFANVSIDAAIDARWPGALPTSWIERKWRGMQHEFTGNPAGCFVAEIAGEVVGYVTTWVVVEDGVGRIVDLAVDSRARGAGLGRRLLERALDYFRQCELRVARIETLSHNQIGRHLYPSLGFEEVATQVHFAADLRAQHPARSAPTHDEAAPRSDDRQRQAKTGSEGVSR